MALILTANRGAADLQESSPFFSSGNAFSAGNTFFGSPTNTGLNTGDAPGISQTSGGPGGGGLPGLTNLTGTSTPAATPIFSTPAGTTALTPLGPAGTTGTLAGTAGGTTAPTLLTGTSFAAPTATTATAAGTTGGLTTNQIIQLGAQIPGLLSALDQSGNGGTGPGVGLPNDDITNQLIATLGDILNSQGQTDVESRNREIARQRVRTSAAVDSLNQDAARLGLSGNVGVQAVAGATQAAGINSIGEIEAQERRLADERMRNDLQLALAYTNLLIEIQAINQGQFNFQQARGDQRDAAQTAALADLGSSIAQIFAS